MSRSKASDPASDVRTSVDHRYGTFEGMETRPDDTTLPECSLTRKVVPCYENEPWWWVPTEENALKLSRFPERIKRFYRKAKPNGCLSVLVEWVLGTLDPADLNANNLARNADRASKRLIEVFGQQIMERNIIKPKISSWLGLVANGARKLQREYPLENNDLTFIKEGPSDPMELVSTLIKFKQPRWLTGWRNITNSTNERSVVGCVIPWGGSGNSLPLWHPSNLIEPKLVSVLVANLSSLPLDYVARQKIPGTNFNYFYAEQLPIFSPNQYSPCDIDFVSSRVLELTYTSNLMKPWADDLGYSGEPLRFDPDRRAELRAEIDAFFARKYQLTRDELRYILDPNEVRGEDYPSETFRSLKKNEDEYYGEYRTQRLVLDAFDRLTGMNF